MRYGAQPMAGKLDLILSKVSGLESEIARLNTKQDVQFEVIKNEFLIVRSEMSLIQEDVSQLKSDMTEVRSDLKIVLNQTANLTERVVDLEVRQRSV